MTRYDRWYLNLWGTVIVFAVTQHGLDADLWWFVAAAGMCAVGMWVNYDD